MQRKQIFVTAEQDEQLKQLAQQQNTSVSALIREAVERFLKMRITSDLTRLTPDVAPEDHPVWSIGGIASGDGPTDGSVNYKKHLYSRRP